MYKYGLSWPPDPPNTQSPSSTLTPSPMSTDAFTHDASLTPAFFKPSSAILAANPPISNLCIGALIISRVASGQRRLLLLRRAATQTTFPSRWEIPGGGIDPLDETLLHSVVRKVKKETGLTVTHVSRVAGATGREWDDVGDGARWRKYTFEVEVLGADDVEVRIDAVQHAQWMWVASGDLEALEMTTEGERKVVELALAGEAS